MSSGVAEDILHVSFGEEFDSNKNGCARGSDPKKSHRKWICAKAGIQMNLWEVDVYWARDPTDWYELEMDMRKAGIQMLK